MRAGLVSLRDAIPADAEEFVSYWHCSGDEHLNFLGIDRKKLGTPEETRDRFMRMIRGRAADQPAVIFTITLNDGVVGYTNLNRYGPEDNYPHLHTYRQSVRSVVKRPPTATGDEGGGAGIGTVIIGPILGMFFDLFPIRRLVLQTRTRNIGINRALDKYLPAQETAYFETPDGVAGPGEFHMRYVFREDMAWIFRRARVLATGGDNA
jgi:RimJ/RimL family protein N-acetyltransferase